MELRPQIGHLKKNQNFHRPFKWLVLSLCSIFLSLPFFGIASSVQAAGGDPSFDFSPSPSATTADTITGTWRSGELYSAPPTYVKIDAFGTSSQCALTATYPGSDVLNFVSPVAGTYTTYVYNDYGADSTCTTLSYSYPGDPLLDGTADYTVTEAPGGGGGSTTEVFSPSMLDAERTIALGVAFLVMIGFGVVGYKASSV